MSVAPFSTTCVGREECGQQHEDTLLQKEVQGSRQGKKQCIGGISAVEREGQAGHMQGDGTQCTFDYEGKSQEEIAQMGINADKMLGAVAVAAVFGVAVALP